MTIRFDDEAFFIALDRRRQRLGTTWRAVARELGVSPSTFSRLARGRRPDVDTFAKLVHWLSVPADRFIVGGTPRRGTKEADPIALLAAALETDPSVSPQDAATLEDIFRVAYTRLRRTSA